MRNTRLRTKNASSVVATQPLYSANKRAKEEHAFLPIDKNSRLSAILFGCVASIFYHIRIPFARVVYVFPRKLFHPPIFLHYFIDFSLGI